MEPRYVTRDPDTGRELHQLTTTRGNSYPLYYFVPSITADGRYLIFHSERSGWVQLYRIDLESGEIGQLTDGRTEDCGWAIWCERHLRGIYTHLSALNVHSGDVFYFEGEQIRASNVGTLQTRKVIDLPPGRMPIGQSAFSPDGSSFAFIHADRVRYIDALNQREALERMGLFDWQRDHERFRESFGGVTIGLIDTRTGEYRSLMVIPFHVHHVLFADDTTLLLNHPRNCKGMWTLGTDGSPGRHLRPSTSPGASGAEIEHQVVTRAGICYEAVRNDPTGKTMFVGRCDHEDGTFEEIPLPDGLGYTHVGADPAGTFLFVEKSAPPHEILSVHYPRDPARRHLQTLRKLNGSGNMGQRSHAHPFLSPDRRWMYFTDLAENGFYQIYRLDVADAVNLDHYW